MSFLIMRCIRLLKLNATKSCKCSFTLDNHDLTKKFSFNELTLKNNKFSKINIGMLSFDADRISIEFFWLQDKLKFKYICLGVYL